MSNEEYYVVPVVGDDPVHSDECPFCSDMSCPCHEDSEAVQATGQAYNDGFMTEDEADRLYHGKTI